MATVKKQTDKQVPMQDNIANFISNLEKLDSRVIAEEKIRALLERREENIFMLGGYLDKLYRNTKWWDDSYDKFSDYIGALGIRYRRAMYAIDLYNKVMTLGLSPSEFDGIGLGKLIRLRPVITKENAAEWVEKAKAMTIPSLEAAVEQAKKHGPSAKAPAQTAKVVSKVFKLHPDQKELCEQGLKKAKEEVPTTVDTVAFEAILQDYMGSGISFTTWEQAVDYAGKHVTGEPEEFIGKVIGKLEELFPKGIIYAVYPSKDAAEQLAPALQGLLQQTASAEAA